MRIDSGGRVMIAETSNSGYSANADDLIVGNNGSATERGISIGATSGGSIRWNDGSDTGIIEYAHSSDSMRLYTAGSERMRIDSSGNVGIGLTAPTHILHVQGTSNDTIDETKGTMKVQASGGNGMILGTIASSPYTSYIQSAYVQDTSLAQYNLALNPIGGNVGIGTSSPSTALEVDGTITFGTANSTIADNNLRFKSSGASYIDHNTVGQDINFRVSNASSLDTTALTIDSSGNVGIGMTPIYRLDVTNNSTGIQGRFASSSSSGTSLSFQNSATNGRNYRIGTNFVAGAGEFSIYDDTASAERMRITSAGDVGIGMTPAVFGSDTVLSIYDAGTPRIKLHNSASGTAKTDGAEILLYSDGTHNDLIIENRENGHQRFYTNGGERMRITSAGKFVVGDTAALNSGGALGSFVFSGGQGLFISTVSQSTGEVMGFVHQKTSVVGTIAINSSSTTYNTSSDARLKDITGEARGLDVINALNPVAYNWKKSGQADEGLIAQEVQEIVPNAVSQNSDQYYQMDYSKLVTYLVKGMQEQQTIIDDLKSRIETLEG